LANPNGSMISGYDVTRGPLSMFFAGSLDRKDQAAAVIQAVGFKPHYVGSIRYSRNLEAIAELWIHSALPRGQGVDWGFNFHFDVIGR
jgi:hypothetical protein